MWVSRGVISSGPSAYLAGQGRFGLNGNGLAECPRCRGDRLVYIRRGLTPCERTSKSSVCENCSENLICPQVTLLKSLQTMSVGEFKWLGGQFIFSPNIMPFLIEFHLVALCDKFE